MAPFLILRNLNRFIRVENTTNGVQVFFNKATLFVQNDGGTSFVLRNDNYIASYRFADVLFPTFSDDQELIDILMSWLDDANAPGITTSAASLFGNLQRHVVLNASKNPAGELSALRDVASSTGDGQVVVGSGPEYELRLGTADGTASLRTAKRGVYVPSTNAEASVAVRLSSDDFSGSNKVARFGYYDDTDGFFFVYDAANGLGVVVRNAGTDTRIARSDWNVDRLDGAGPSGATLDLTRGNVFRIEFEWFGYGSVRFRVLVSRGRKETLQTVHYYQRTTGGGANVQTPQLPLRTELANEGTTTTQTAVSLYVLERQLAVTGVVDVLKRALLGRRNTPVERLDAPVDQEDGYVPVLSVRKKAGRLRETVRIAGLHLSADEDCVYQVRVRGELLDSGGSAITWGESIDDVPPEETALEKDTSAKTINGGIAVYSGLFTPPQITQTSTARDMDYALAEDEPLSVCVKSYKANLLAVSVVGQFLELW